MLTRCVFNTIYDATKMKQECFGAISNIHTFQKCILKHECKLDDQTSSSRLSTVQFHWVIQ